MSRTKLKKFAQLQSMSHVIQPAREDLLSNKFSLKGSWLSFGAYLGAQELRP